MNFIIYWLILLGTLAWAAGTESGGGGGGVYWMSGRPVLMDHFTIIKESLPWVPGETGQPSRIPVAKSLAKEPGDPALQAAAEILHSWQTLPNDPISLSVSMAIRGPRWLLVDSDLSAPPFYVSPQAPKGLQSEVAAYYSNAKYPKVEVQINRRIWNQMTLTDQAGLLIHETLRLIQIGYGIDYSDEALQRATAIYLNCAPSSRLNFYLFFVLNNSPESADKRYGSFETFVTKECQRL